jgi:hypothetical protein
MVLSNADLTVTSGNAASQVGRVRATSGKTSGKWYFEMLVVTDNAGSVMGGKGVGISSTTNAAGSYIGWNHVNAQHYEGYAGNGWTGRYASGHNFIAYRSTYVGADVVGVAADLDNRQMWVSKNNVWQGGGDPSTLTSPSHSNAFFTAGVTWYPTFWLDDVGTGSRPAVTARFAPGSFTYAVPTGFAAWS